jgi:pimeloyl-ACP methyl ester carboxylesterase
VFYAGTQFARTDRRLRIARLALAATALILCGAADAAPTLTPSGALYVDCRGERSAAPTVILQSGAFGAAADWSLALPDLAVHGRVCAYDRGGIGASPARADAPTPEAIARELAGLLDSIGETRPVILVGHSNGALYAEAFAALWPERTAGLVYVNGVTSDDLDYPALIDDLETERRLSDLAGVVGNLDLGPLVGGILAGSLGLDGEAAERKRAAISRPEQIRTARDEDRAIIPGLAQVRALGGSPPGVPTAVIVGALYPNTSLSMDWRAAETASATRARRSWILDAPGASHTSPLARDRAYVVAAVDWLWSLTPPAQ